MRHTHLSLPARCALNQGERGAKIFVHHTPFAPPLLQFGQITSLSYKQGFAFIDYADQRDAQVPYSQPELFNPLPSPARVRGRSEKNHRS